VKYYCFFCN